MEPWHVERRAPQAAKSTHADAEHYVPGTAVLVGVFLACFAVYYFANWKWLADVWWVR